ncbi:MAG: hypothetical protein U0974_16140, partial [Gemmatimonadales bacterium]|nr:hypothetical protein [Gemmatimonadales bacterium]
MFIVVLGSILGLMHVYVWKRTVKDTTRPGRIRRILSVVLLALLTLLVVTVFLPRFLGFSESGWYAWPGYLWFGVIAYLFLALLVLEPIRLALWAAAKRTDSGAGEQPDPAAVDRRLFLARAGAVAAGAAAVGLVGAGAASALGPPNLLRVPVRLGRLDPAFDGFRIAVVSDIHLGPLVGR